ncbi:hypothetical protein GCM10028805_07620 [Spirosoma harenae]
MKASKSLLVSIFLAVNSNSNAQIAIKANLSIVINSVTSEDITVSDIEEKAILVELENISNQPQIILHNKPIRDHIKIFIDSINASSVSKKFENRKGFSRPNYNGLYEKLITKNSENQQELIEISTKELAQLGIHATDSSVHNKLFGIIINPKQVFRDLKYFRRELNLSGTYRYKYFPLQLEAKVKETTIKIKGQTYYIALPETFESNELKLTTFKD